MRCLDPGGAWNCKGGLEFRNLVKPALDGLGDDVRSIEAQEDESDGKEPNEGEKPPNRKLLLIDFIAPSAPGNFLTSPDERRADEAAHNAGGLQEQGQNHGLRTERGEAENHRGHHRDGVALENICRHAGTVADIIAHVVGNGRGIAGSSSGMLASILPTRSAPTSAALV